MNDRQSEYERLIAPIQDRMMRTVWRIVRDPDDADDAFQEALLSIWKQWSRVQKHPNPHALVLRICINSAHDMLRRKTRRMQREDASAIPAELPATAPSLTQAICDAEQCRQVLQAIGSLSKNQAQAILMHTVEEIPYAEVASAMRCREVTVRKHVARARARLRTLLSHLFPSAGKEEAHV